MPSRRELIAGSALTFAPAFQARGANDRLRAAVIGVKGRGRVHMNCVHKLAGENIELAAVCDPDETVLQQRAADFEKLSGKRIAAHTDMRRLLEDKSIDVVFHATPTHWHGLGALWTLEAGKDAYVEKPLAHNLVEGRKLVEAARRHKRIVQHGTQCRSGEEILEGIEKLRQGVIGEVFLARAVSYKWRPPIGKPKPQDPPKTLHYDLWLGPAAWKPYSENHVHYNWHWFWETGNGDMGNIGVHSLDIIRLGLNLTEHPTRVYSTGGRFMYDDRDTPDYQAVHYEFAGRKLMVSQEVRNGITNTEAGCGDLDRFPFRLGPNKTDAQGVIFIGREGYMVIPDYTSYHVFLGQQRKPGPKRSGTGDPFPDTPHIANFLKAVRSRKESDLAAPVLEGHLSAALCHLGNIAYRVGRPLTFDPKTERCVGDPEANRLLGRAYRKPFVLPS